jgi:hypothetical protein
LPLNPSVGPVQNRNELAKFSITTVGAKRPEKLN